MGCYVEYDVDSAISRYRNATAESLDGLPTPKKFVNPQEGRSVLAADFLAHLDLDRPAINRVLKQAYPHLDILAGLKAEVHARVRFTAWRTLKGFNELAIAHRLLVKDVHAQKQLGFVKGPPCYDTLREHENERLSGDLHDRLLDALLIEQRRMFQNLGQKQVEDATPLEARRREEEAPYNPHYGVRMMKEEMRWDVEHEALLAQQYYHGLVNEGQWLPLLTRRVQAANIHGARLTVDGAYPSFEHIALQWRLGEPLAFKQQEGWRVDAEAAREDVLKRYQGYWKHDSFLSDANLDAKLRFLIDHGTVQDVEAVGRYVRDAYLSTRSIEEDAVVKRERSMNEGLNAEFKRLPVQPARRGTRELLRRAQACTLTLHLVQLTRLQHGVTRQLCRTANLL